MRSLGQETPEDSRAHGAGIRVQFQPGAPPPPHPETPGQESSKGWAAAGPPSVRALGEAAVNDPGLGALGWQWVGADVQAAGEEEEAPP